MNIHIMSACDVVRWYEPTTEVEKHLQDLLSQSLSYKSELEKLRGASSELEELKESLVSDLEELKEEHEDKLEELKENHKSELEKLRGVLLEGRKFVDNTLLTILDLIEVSPDKDSETIKAIYSELKILHPVKIKNLVP